MHPSCCPTAVSITCAKWKGDKAHFPCLPEQLMEFADLVYGQVDFAPLCCSWPQDKLEQIGVLKDICAEAWHHSCGPGVESYLARKANAGLQGSCVKPASGKGGSTSGKNLMETRSS